MSHRFLRLPAAPPECKSFPATTAPWPLASVPPPGRLRPGHPLQRRPVARRCSGKSRVRAPASVECSMAQRGRPADDANHWGHHQRPGHPVQLGGGVRNGRAGPKALLSCGLDGILGNRGDEEPQLVRQPLAALPSPAGIVVESSAETARWATAAGGRKSHGSRPSRFCRQALEGSGVGRDHQSPTSPPMAPGRPNLGRRCARWPPPVPIPVIASGGVGIAHRPVLCLALEPLGVSGVIVGRRDLRRQRSPTRRGACRLGGPARWQDLSSRSGG